MNILHGFRTWGRIMAAVAAVIVFATTPGFADVREIATLHSFEGDVMMKNGGIWGVTPQCGMPIYHGDKIVTDPECRMRIRFPDGSVLDILPDSDVCLLEPWSRGEAYSQNLSGEREIRLSGGTVVYKNSPNASVETRLVSPESSVSAPPNSDIQFEASEKLAFVNNPERKIRKSDSAPHMPVMKAEKKNHPDEQKSSEAHIRKAYIDAVKQLTGSMNE